MKQHQHGADVQEIMEVYNKQQIVDFSSNVNIFHPNDALKHLRSLSMDQIQNYPDINYINLRNQIAMKYGKQIENVIVGNGSTEIMFLVNKLQSIKTVGIICPTFGEYQRSAAIEGKHIVPFYYNRDFSIPVDELSLENIDILFVCNPNNPSGNSNNLKKLLNKCQSTNTLLFVDETFMDFQKNKENSLLELAGQEDNLMVLKALTKFYSLAGVRLGYGFSKPSIIEELWGKKEPWTVNVFAEASIPVIFDQSFEEKTIDFFAKEIKWLKKELSKVEGLYTYPTETNYFLVKILKPVSAKELKERLILNWGILIRDCSNYQGLDSQHFRINIKDREHNMLILRAIKKELE